ncbi:PucR family transcriptional regulator [Nocardia asteroides]|uniref:PucR family transcriptional regulator n=1 Tax=Nocardia asteroides TaxID=1824 RepID=UPI0036651BC5
MADTADDTVRVQHLVAAFADVEDAAGVAAIEDVIGAWVRQGVSVEDMLRYAVLREHHSAVHAITAALLEGQATPTIARRYGVEIAPYYWVVAVAVHPPATGTRAEPNRAQARRRLEQIRAALFRWSEGAALSLLSGEGGTALIPGDIDAAELDSLFTAIERAAEVPVTAVVAHCCSESLPLWTDRAHNLLDVVQRLGIEGRLHQFSDLALEYQITRPGPARQFLAALLDPLDEHPELLATLRCYVDQDVNRQRTARALHVHPNTLDFRLKRIARLTGCDAARGHGEWRLRSALIARHYQSADGEHRGR